MCGRYYIDDEDERAEMRRILEEVNRRYKGSALCARMKTGEIFPTDVVPVLTPTARDAGGDPAPSVHLMQWGMTLPQSGSVIINARAESAAEKPMFRQSVRQGRVLLPANAFYEWQKKAEGKGKTRYCLSVPGDNFFYMAGLYRPEPLSPEDALKLYGSEEVPGNGEPSDAADGPEREDAPADGGFRQSGRRQRPTINRFVIITMPASPWMNEIHDRMPMILDREAARSWLLDPNAALAMLAAPSASVLESLRQD